MHGQGDGEEVLETTGDGGVGMGRTEATKRPRKRKGRHYDAKDDVILRLEALPPLEVKVSVSMDACFPYTAESTDPHWQGASPNNDKRTQLNAMRLQAPWSTAFLSVYRSRA